MFKRLYNKFKKWLYYKIYDVQLTPKGEYFYKYLTSIVTGQWQEKDFVECYEDAIEELRSLYNLTREQAVCYYYLHFKEVAERAAKRP